MLFIFKKNAIKKEMGLPKMWIFVHGIQCYALFIIIINICTTNFGPSCIFLKFFILLIFAIILVYFTTTPLSEKQFSYSI